MKNKRIFSYWVLSLALLTSVILSLSVGAVSLSFSEIGEILAQSIGLKSDSTVTEIQRAIFWNLRIPRVGFAVLIGSGLALAGVALQGIFRNPLVDAGIVGIASGASLFAAAFIVLSGTFPFLILGNQQINLALIAFSGALITAFLVYRISKFDGKVNTVLLILAGVALNALAGSITGLITYFAKDDQLRDLIFWSLGSLSGATNEHVLILLPFIVIPFYFLLKQRTALNAFALGESSAFYLGINTHKTKITVLVSATAMVGASVSLAGAIGFIGLVIPHILRLAIGPNHKDLLPLSALAGATLLNVADVLSRVLLPPTEIPIGIITAVIGTPVLIGIIIKQKKLIFT